MTQLLYSERKPLPLPARRLRHADSQTIEPWAVSEQTNDSEGAYLSVLLKVTTRTALCISPSRIIMKNMGCVHSTTAATVWEAGKYIYTLNYTTGAGYVILRPKIIRVFLYSCR